MAKAVFNGKTIAESADTEVVEGNHYFPPGSVKMEFFELSDTESVCPWKGTASYYNVQVDGQTSKDACWYYPSATDAAKRIEGYFAFWKDVAVEN